MGLRGQMGNGGDGEGMALPPPLITRPASLASRAEHSLAVSLSGGKHTTSFLQQDIIPEIIPSP